MTDQLNQTLAIMKQLGGGFAAALAEAAYRADTDNLQRLLDAFPELFDRYASLLEDQCPKLK